VAPSHALATREGAARCLHARGDDEEPLLRIGSRTDQRETDCDAASDLVDRERRVSTATR